MVCLISPSKNAYSETFIRAHAERLPARVRVLHGGFFPRYQDDDTPLLSKGFTRRAARMVLRKALRLPKPYFKRVALKRFLIRSRAEAVLAEYGPTGVAVMDVCKEVGVPLVVHFHGFDAHNSVTLNGPGQSYPRLFSQSAAIVVVSKDMVAELGRLGAPSDKLHCIPCGADTSLFCGANPATAPPVFVFASRFVDVKGPHLTLLAFKSVLDQVPDARLVMIGDGALWEACCQLAHGLGVSHAVEFRGAIPHGGVAEAMRTARAFVQHSIGSISVPSEGTPVAVMEAGAAGLPAVVTRNGGIKDVVVDRETGLLVREGDVEGMAECMIRLSEDPVLAAELGRRARERVLAEFSIERSIARLWHVIQDAIQRNGQAC